MLPAFSAFLLFIRNHGIGSLDCNPAIFVMCFCFLHFDQFICNGCTEFFISLCLCFCLSDHIPRSSSGLVLRTHDAHQGSCVHSSYREAQHRDSRSGCSCHAGCWPDGAFSFSYFSVLEITFLPLSGEVRASPYVVVIYLDFQKHPLLNPWTSFFVHFSTQPFFPEADFS